MKLIFVLVLGMFAFGGWEDVHAADLPVAETIEGMAVDVVLVGWGHFFGNGTIPSILIQELTGLTDEAARRTSLIVEWPEGASEDLFDLPVAQRTELVHLKRVMAAARAKGVKVVLGDHRDRLTQKIDFRLRDKSLTNAAILEVREGRKAIVWLGSSHCYGVARYLRNERIRFRTFMTTYNPFTGEVRWGDRHLPTADPDPVMVAKYPRARPSEGWVGLKNPDRDHLNILFHQIRRACAALLGV